MTASVPEEPRPAVPQFATASTLMACGIAFVALIVLFAGYIIVSGTTRESHQLLGIDIGFSSLLIAGGTGVGWLTMGHRGVRSRQRSVLARMRELDDVYAAKAVLRGADAAPVSTSKALVAVPGGTLFHLSSCPLVLDKDIAESSLTEHIRAQRKACGICAP